MNSAEVWRNLERLVGTPEPPNWISLAVESSLLCRVGLLASQPSPEGLSRLSE